MVQARVARRGDDPNVLILCNYEDYKRVWSSGSGSVAQYKVVMRPEQMKAFEEINGINDDVDLVGVRVDISILRNIVGIHDYEGVIPFMCKVKKLKTKWYGEEEY